MNIDIEALEAAAKAATPGPWVRGPYGGIYPAPPEGSDKRIGGPEIGGCRNSNHVPRRHAEENERFMAATNPEVVLELLRRLRDAEGNHAASCIYCGEAVIYDVRQVGEIESAHHLLVEHDRQCSKNPVVQEVGALKAHCRELRLALFNAGAEAAGVAGRLSGEDEMGPDPDSALLQPLMDIHDAAAEALRGYPAMSLAREKVGGQEPDARGKAAVLLELARDYRNMGVDTDVIENLRARAGMELATVGIALQEFEESQS